MITKYLKTLVLIVLACQMYVVAANTLIAEDRIGFHAKLATVPPATRILGEGWTGPEGLVVEDVNNLSAFDADSKPLIEMAIKSLSGSKVTGFADWTYTRGDPLLTVTVRTFVFKNSEDAKKWWNQRYEAPGWEKRFKKVEGLGDRALESREHPKRSVLTGNVILSASQIKGDEYMTALTHYLREMSPKPASKD